MSYYVYLIKTISSKFIKSYVGYTNNISKRLEKHNTGKGAKSTKGFKWKLIYKKKFISKSKAMSYEYKLKKDRKTRNEIINKKK
jgi:putative endonuclease